MAGVPHNNNVRPDLWDDSSTSCFRHCDTQAGISQDVVRTFVATNDVQESEIEINYPVISYFDVDLDKKYPLIDIFYPKSTK